MNVIWLTLCVLLSLAEYLPEVAAKGQLGDICNQDMECSSFIFGSFCKEGRCKCKSTHMEFEHICVVEFGDSCLQTTDTCKGTNVKCRRPTLDEWLKPGIGPVTCMCHNNFTMHKLPDTCKAKIMSLCNNTTKECNDGECDTTKKCEVGELCVGSDCKRHGEPCKSGDLIGTCVNMECMVDTCQKGNCPMGRCSCPKPLVPTKNMARCLPDLNGTCDSGCADENAECKDKTCSCKTDYQTGDSKYWEKECKRSLGASCIHRTQCAHKSASCLQTSKVGNTKACVCGVGFVARRNHSDCLPAASKECSSCEEDLQCQVKLGRKSHCEEEKCQCKDNFEFDDDEGICVKK